MIQTRPLIFAHRGASGDYPENTFAAFEAAAETGCDGIELDVHLSADGTPMVIHDETIDRTTGLRGAVKDFQSSDLELMNASRVKGKIFAGAGGKPAAFTRDKVGIPRLDDYLAWVKGTKLITNIELKTDKCYYPHLEEKVLAAVRKYGLEDRIVFSSFNWASVMIMKRLAPEIKAGFLREDRPIEYIGELAKAAGVEFYHPGLAILDESTVIDCRDCGIGLNVWTVNKPSEYHQIATWGVHGVITNYPAEMMSST
jgi:glycerophosphoryl diester phosphodiesterase